ncbi:hypothetical protein EDB85DRAFT_1897744 [Lactarius pseudohatsudake]|nr:hypothetical protein EDB85DRAFT_1897744 [Lactarius pseudohatsudake]
MVLALRWAVSRWRRSKRGLGERGGWQWRCRRRGGGGGGRVKTAPVQRGRLEEAVRPSRWWRRGGVVVVVAVSAGSRGVAAMSMWRGRGRGRGAAGESVVVLRVAAKVREGGPAQLK